MTGVWCNLVNSVSYVEWRAVPCTWVVQAGLLDQLAEDADVIGHRVIQRLQPLLNAFQFHCLGLSLLGSARTKQKTRDSEAGGWRPKGARSMPENIFMNWLGKDNFSSYCILTDFCHMHFSMIRHERLQTCKIKLCTIPISYKVPLLSMLALFLFTVLRMNDMCSDFP